MSNYQLNLQAKNFLSPEFQVALSQRFKALLMADAVSLQGARHLTLAARGFFNGSTLMESGPPSGRSNEEINDALLVGFIALKAWLNLLPALKIGRAHV